MAVTLLVARLVLATIFLTAGIGKLLDPAGSRVAITEFGVPPWLAKPLGIVLPILELAVAIGLVLTVTAWGAAATALALLSLFIFAITRALARGKAPDCHCFGQLHSSPAGRWTLLRNAALAALATLIVAYGPGDVGASATAWLGRIGTAELMALAALLGLAIVLIAGTVLLVALLREHGRALVRLDQLEATLTGAGLVLPGQTATNGHLHADAGTIGLPVGAPAPHFELPDTLGESISLTDLLEAGLPVMLVFTDPDCGPCREILPLVADWQREHSDQVTIAVLSEGDTARTVAKREELGLHRVLMQRERDVAEAYDSWGTPTAVLISSEGRIASPLGAGSSGIHTVVQQVLAPGLEVRIHQPSPSAAGVSQKLGLGSDAPEFELPTIDGGTVSLEGLRGRATVLLFWNPSCGFCSQMAPELRSWWEDHFPEQPQLLVISRGSADENAELGPAEWIAIDDAFQVGSLFGATGTPMGVLLDEEGRLASPLVAGAEAVFRLLNAGERTKEVLVHG